MEPVDATGTQLTGTPPDAVQSADAPDRGRRKQSRQPAGTNGSRPAEQRRTARSPVADEPSVPWTRRLAQWLAGFAAISYGLSLLLHTLALIIVSLIVIPHALQDRFQINVSEGDKEGVEDELVEVIDTRIDLPSVEQNPLESLPMTQIMPQETDESSLTESIRENIDNALGALAAEESGGALPEGGKKGKNAVTKGSFTAWTFPDDPPPGKDYVIIIEIELPEGIGRYDSKDLSGFVIGTDGYTTPIGHHRGGRVTPRGAYHASGYYGMFIRKRQQFRIRIPHAREALVEDTIRVRSKLLKEEQTLKIVF